MPTRLIIFVLKAARSVSLIFVHGAWILEINIFIFLLFPLCSPHFNFVGAGLCSAYLCDAA